MDTDKQRTDERLSTFCNGDPLSPTTLYVITSGDVFKSTNAGESWTNLDTGIPTLTVLAIDPVDPTILYAGIAKLYGTEGGVFKSIDAGETWTAANVGIRNHSVRGLVIDPDRPTTLYAGATPDFSAEVTDVFKSINGGASWGQVNDIDYVSSLAIDPNSPTTVYAGGLDRVYKSVDGGETWTSTVIGAVFGELYVGALAIPPSTTTIVYAGTSRGVFKSTNGGDSWVEVNRGLPSFQRHPLGSGYSNVATLDALTVDPTTPMTLYAGTDRGVFRSTDGASSWNAINMGSQMLM